MSQQKQFSDCSDLMQVSGHYSNFDQQTFPDFFKLWAKFPDFSSDFKIPCFFPTGKINWPFSVISLIRGYPE
jgi:hypothetical protein